MAPHNRVFLLCFQHVLDTICMTCTPVELFEFLLSVLRPAPHALYHSHLTSNQHLQLAALGLHYNTHSKEPPPTPRRQLIPRQHAAVGNVAIPSNKDTGIIAMTHCSQCPSFFLPSWERLMSLWGDGDEMLHSAILSNGETRGAIEEESEEGWISLWLDLQAI